jgi:hypothetical protein
MLHAVQHEWIDLVGLSVAYSDHLDALTELIKALRLASRNPALQVMRRATAAVPLESVI